jgi:1-deoxy-D-xylulose-5-phosphate reductoisomerase
MSAANEAAVALFLGHRLGYNEIYDLVAQAVDALAEDGSAELDKILQADQAAREFIRAHAQ